MEFRVSVLLSVQRALWGLVSPNLRGVAAISDYPNIVVRFLFDLEPADDDREDVSEAESGPRCHFLAF